jgi:antitoxin FitA
MHSACGACIALSWVAVANVQVRGVPDDVHRRLKAQAALAGLSLNEFLLSWMRDVARTPTVPELAERIRARGAYEGPSSASALRAERGAR